MSPRNASLTKCRSLIALVPFIVAMVGSLIAPSLILRTASASPATTGTWTLYPPQATISTTAAQPPINTDGSSSWPAARGVIPVKFSLSTAPGPVVFQSILSDGSDSSFPGTDDFSFLSFAPSPSLTFSQITSLKANYNFIMGNCGGGSLRWEITVDIGNDSNPVNDKNVFIYYGDYPNFTDCTTNSQSGVNMIGQPDLRYDTSQVGGAFYDSYADASALVGSLPVVGAALVLDSGWFNGDQKINVSNVMVNDNTFVPLSGQPAQTCTLPPAMIKVTKISPATMAVSEVASIQPFDNNSVFRIVDCKYIYNLDVRSLNGSGTYKVEAVFGSSTALGPAYFSLR